MMPPMMMKLAIYEKGQKRFNFWIPLIVFYLLLSPIFLFVLPFLLVANLVMWVGGAGKTPVSLLGWLYELWCATKGTIIEVDSRNKDRVFIRIF